MKLVRTRKRIAKGIHRWNDGRWEIFLRVVPLPAVHRHLDASYDLRGVRKWIEDKRAELRHQAKGVGPQKGTLAGDVARFLRLLDGNKKLQNERRAQLALWCAPFGHRARHSLEATELQQQLADWAGNGYSYSTIKHRRDALVALYRELDRVKDFKNPVLATQVPLSKPDPEPRGLPFDVVQQILGHVSDQGGVIQSAAGRVRLDASKARIRIHVMAYTGMRPVELKRYQPGDWQRSLHQLAVRAAKASNNRMVPLIPEAERWLLELERHDAIGPFDNGVIERAFHRALVKAGLAPKQRVKGPRTGPRPRTGLPRPYDLRHSLMTALTLETESTNAAQWMAGHKDPRMTQRYSLNAIPSVLRAAVDKLAAKMNREKLPEKVTKAVNS